MSLILKKKLNEIFGESFSIDETELLAYSTDASQIRGKALAVVFPKNQNQIIDLVRHAIKYNYKLVPRGAGTGLCGGAVPDKSIVIDLSKMDRIIQINVKEKTATIQPGVVLEDLNKKLNEFGLVFPVIPSSHKASTIGGMAATNAAGLRAFKYGKMEKWVIGLKAVDGNGYEKFYNNIQNKNNKERNPFIGSEGIFGVITELKLKLAENIKAVKHNVFEAENVDELMVELDKAVLDPDTLSVEFINKKASEFIGWEKKYYLFTEKESDEDTEDPGKDIAEKREGISVMIGGEGYEVTEDPWVPEDKIKDFLIWLEDKEIPSFGHIAYGIIHPRFKKNQTALIKEMMNYVLNLGGQVSGEHGIGIVKKNFLDNEKRNEMSKIKHAYDRKNIMNPGKII